MNENPPYGPPTERIEAMIERRVMELQTLVFERLNSVEAARVIQATEYERRLSLLNGEHATLSQMKNDFVLRIIFDAEMNRLRAEAAAQERLANDDRQKQTEATQATRRNAMVAWGGFLTAAMGWAISYFLTRGLPK